MQTRTTQGDYWELLPLNKIHPMMYCLGNGGKLRGKHGIVCYTTEYKVTINLMNELGIVEKRKISVDHFKFKFWTNSKIRPPLSRTSRTIPFRISTTSSEFRSNDSDHSTIESQSVLTQLNSISSLDQINEITSRDKNNLKDLLTKFKAFGLTNRTIRTIADIALDEIDREMDHNDRS